MLMLPVLGLPIAARAQTDLCDPALKQITDTPLGYRLRGDRCEGLYVKEVGASLLRVVGLTERFDRYDAAAGKPLVLEWSTGIDAAASARVRLRAEALRPRSYYRMDTQRPVDAASFTWPGDLLASQRFERQDLGLLAMVQATVVDSLRTVFLPLRVHQQSGAPRAGTYRLLLMPGVDLDQVFLSVGAAGPGGRAAAWQLDSVPQPLGYLPAARAFAIDLPLPGAAGVYHAQLGARLRGGGSATVDLWFHHDGHRAG